jgi:hypothetical protein
MRRSPASTAAALEAFAPAVARDRRLARDPATFRGDRVEQIEERFDLVSTERPDAEVRHQRPTA